MECDCFNKRDTPKYYVEMRDFDGDASPSIIELDKWVKIEDDGLPNFYNDVVVYCSDGYVSIGYADQKNGVFLGFRERTADDFFLKEVTHWKTISLTPPKDI